MPIIEDRHSMKILTALCLISTFVLAAQDRALPPGTRAVDPTLVVNGLLSLPEVKSTIAAPSKEWIWVVYESASGSYIKCLGPDSSEFVVSVIPSKYDLEKLTVEALGRDIRKNAKDAKAVLLSEEGRLTEIPGHQKVFYTKHQIQLRSNVKFFEQYFFAAENNMIMIAARVDDDAGSALLRNFASGLKLPPPLPPQKRKDPMIYAYFGAFGYALAFLVNALFRRTVIGPAALASIFLSAGFIYGLANSDENHRQNSAGYNFGLALLPGVFFAILLKFENKAAAAKEAAAKAATTSYPVV